MSRFTVIAATITSVLLLTAGCAKKTIDPGPFGRPSDSAAADGQVETRNDPDSSRQNRSVAEGSSGERDGRFRMTAADAATERKAFENRDGLFDYDSAVLSPSAQDVLRDKARWLQANPDVRVIIEGHCDDRGTNEYNLALGERRARSARRFLETLGVESSRTRTVSYGEERPLETGTSEEIRARNRRAHFVIER